MEQSINQSIDSGFTCKKDQSPDAAKHCNKNGIFVSSIKRKSIQGKQENAIQYNEKLTRQQEESLCRFIKSEFSAHFPCAERDDQQHGGNQIQQKSRCTKSSSDQKIHYNKTIRQYICAPVDVWTKQAQ